jgi:hypothetical protein
MDVIPEESASVNIRHPASAVNSVEPAQLNQQSVAGMMKRL